MFRAIEANCWSPEVRIEECNATNVDVQVLSTVPVLFNYSAKPDVCLEISQFLNNHIDDICKRHPDRFIGAFVCAVPLAFQQSFELSRVFVMV